MDTGKYWMKQELSSGSLKVICHKGIVTLVEEEKGRKAHNNNQNLPFW